MKRRGKRFLALALALALLLPGCAGGNAAATMQLAKFTGSIGVEDGAGKAVAAAENLGLYSGYRVATAAESYAWLRLDSAKLAKMDQDGLIEITREGKALAVEVISGSFFFNVTEPLAEDESLQISSSNMLVGIRGTCGWVELPGPGRMDLYLLEGTVEVTAGQQTAAVTAGQRARMQEDGSIALETFDTGALPAFVAEALANPDGWGAPGAAAGSSGPPQGPGSTTPAAGDGGGDWIAAEDGLEWRIEGDTLYIRGEGYMHQYGNMPGYRAPWLEEDFTRVVVEPGLTQIGVYAFVEHTGLTEVSLPDTVHSIEQYAFWGCSSLTTVDLDDVYTLGNGCFWDCTSLTSLSLPNRPLRLIGNPFVGSGVTDLYSAGSEEDWAKVTVEDENALSGITVHFEG